MVESNQGPDPLPVGWPHFTATDARELTARGLKFDEDNIADYLRAYVERIKATALLGIRGFRLSDVVLHRFRSYADTVEIISRLRSNGFTVCGEEVSW